jgi:hypothetical protein
MTGWKWTGPQWWKFGFYVHTLESINYEKGQNQETLKKRTREWLLDYMRTGIDCVALTD